MPSDGLTTMALAGELNEALTGLSVVRIHQPSRSEILMRFSGPARPALLLCADSSWPRVHLTSQTGENPGSPPAFCMLLRKHLMGGAVKSVTQKGFDRILEIRVESISETAVMTRFRLIAEITGRISNIILVSEPDGMILDAINRVSAAKSSFRQILPQTPYKSPPAGRLNPLDFDGGEAEDLLALNRADSSARALMQVFDGLSPALAASVASDIPVGNHAALAGAVRDFFCGIELRPGVYRGENSLVRDYSAVPYAAITGFEREDTPGISAAVQAYHQTRAFASAASRHADKTKKVASLLKREEGKLEIRRAEEAGALDYERNRVSGELLLAGLSSIRKGDTSFETTDYYTGLQVSIPLRPALSPSENAKAYFKRYSKDRNALKVIGGLIAQAQDNIFILEDALHFLRHCESDAQADEIMADLAKAGFFRESRKRAAAKPLPPGRCVSPDGYEIIYGRNSRQNDAVTKSAGRDDIWLHARNIPGSHVILRAKNASHSNEALMFAAGVAAYMSSARSSSSVPVDYTAARNVKKPAGAPAGKVVFTNNRTVSVLPVAPPSSSFRTPDA